MSIGVIGRVWFRAANEPSRVEFWTYRAKLDLKMGELEFELELDEPELDEPIRIELELDSTKKKAKLKLDSLRLAS